MNQTNLHHIYKGKLINYTQLNKDNYLFQERESKKLKSININTTEIKKIQDENLTTCI